MLQHQPIILLLLLPLYGTEAQSPRQPAPPSASHDFLDSSVAIVVGALAASFFFVALFSIFLRRCAQSWVAEQGNNTEWPCSCSHGGIHPKILETFPILFFSAIINLRVRKGGEVESLECAVCLAEFTENDTLRLLPHCNHVFHPPCIDAWLSSHITCPVCRANLTLDPLQVPIVVAPQLSDEETNAEGSGNRAEQSGEGEIEGCPVVREAREGQGNVEEDKGVREFASKSKLLRKGRVLPRSNSTGHSLVEAGECVERYTLRLPEDVRKYILRNCVAVQRSKSYNAVGTSRKGFCWSDSDESSRGKRNSVGMRGQGSVSGKSVK